MPIFRALLLLFLLHSVIALVSAQRSKAPKASPWQTLSGKAPLVIARGGFSGIFPDSSFNAYALASMTSGPNVIDWCDVQLTKDGAGICAPEVNLLNSTDIQMVSPNTSSVYLVNGVSTTGWFSVDYNLDYLLANISLIRGISSRPDRFDGNAFSILTVDDMVSQVQPPALWLNIQHDAFFTQHKLNMRTYVLSVSKRVAVDYISSPEVGFLTSIASRFKGTKTKLVFRFMEAADTEPSTNQTYGSLLKNLTFVKTFASGILVPKSYIWPVNLGGYLLPHTSLVSDAHKGGLEVYGSDFANDNILSYNYSYNPLTESLSFIDNGEFSIDGLLSDFPITPSAAINCFAHIDKNSTGQAIPKVVSHNGASGMYPGSTNLAYQQAVEDGADYIDCSVQMTKDGVPVCLNSINLLDGTTVTQSTFNSLSAKIPEIQDTPGIFAFNLTWKDIQSLKPAISNPYLLTYQLVRNPANKNVGSFMSLAEFLTFANSKPLSGIVINVEHAAYLAEKLGLGVTDAVIDAISKSGYKNGTTQEVVIQSTNKAVLTKFKKLSGYKLMYMIDDSIRSATDSSLRDIKSFADSVAVDKESIFPANMLYLTGSTDVVTRLQSFNLSVYTYGFDNEFVSQAWDFFSDPIVQINTYVMGAGIDGVITDYPGTAASYKKNRCLNLGKKTPVYMTPVQPGSLMQLITTPSLPPAEAPSPILTDADVAEPPLPPVAIIKPASSNDGAAAAPSPTKSDASSNKVMGSLLSFISMFLASILLF